MRILLAECGLVTMQCDCFRRLFLRHVHDDDWTSDAVVQFSRCVACNVIRIPLGNTVLSALLLCTV